MRRSRSKDEDTEEVSELPNVEVFSPSEGKPLGDLVVGESRMEFRSPAYSEAPPRRTGDRESRSRGESGIRKRQPPPQARRPKQPQLPRPKQARPPPPAQRREGFQFQDNYSYDPRPQDHTTPHQPIVPIPIEFINQIPGGGQPLQQGSIRLDPEAASFRPSSHIEQIINGIPKLVEDTSERFFLEGQPKKSNPTTRSLHHHDHQETPIFREEYPKPAGTPYPPVPYHDSRIDKSPPAGVTQATGEDTFRYMAAPHQVP